MQFARLIFLFSSLSHKEAKARHTESSVGSFFVHKLPKGNIPQSNEPCRSSLSSVFRALRNSFSYPRYACITHSQTVLALFPKNIRALIVPFNGAGWILKLPLPAEISASMVTKGYFKKKYSVVKITGNDRREARKRGASFLTRCKRGQTCASRDYQGKVAGKRTTNEGYFRPAKIREQRSE